VGRQGDGVPRRSRGDTGPPGVGEVVDEEWPLMACGESSPRAWALIDEIRLTVQNLNPDTEAGQVLDDQGLQRVVDALEARRPSSTA
jgi:hypothetical protein